MCDILDRFSKSRFSVDHKPGLMIVLRRDLKGKFDIAIKDGPSFFVDFATSSQEAES